MSAEDNPRPRRRFRPPSPSHSLLSVLASIVATSQPVSSSPLTFLCPSRTTPPLGLPDKYQPGDDGLWRKVDEYSLYGSTVCSSSKDPAPPPVDNQIQPPPPSVTPQEAATMPSAPSFDVKNLPPGWTPGTVAKRTSLIVALSIVLTVGICVLMVGCLLFKRVRRERSLNSVDLEKKVKKKRWKHRPPNDAESREREHKAAQKIWARATARWKANARYTAHQRRGKRSISRPLQQNSSLNPRDTITTHPSPSIASQAFPRAECPEQPPIHPPAYQHNFSDLCSANGGSSSQSSSFPSPRSAHVATDDKAVLAQMVGLVSSPPESDVTASGGTAPAWPDEEEDLASRRSSCHTTLDNQFYGSPPLFPPPPSKGKIPASHFDYSYAIHDFGSESELGPSAPPFEEEDMFPEMPSAPPIPNDLTQIDATWDDDVLRDMHITEGLRTSPGPSSPCHTPHVDDPTPLVQGPVDRDGRPPSYQP